MHISIDGVKYLANLARLQLEEDEINSTLDSLEAVLDLCDAIDSYKGDLSDVPAHLTYLMNSWEEDDIHPSISRDDALKNSTYTRAGMFVVPKIVE